MLKIGQKACHYMSSHKVGTIVNIENKKSNMMTIGGTTTNFTVITIQFENGEIIKYNAGEVIRSYD
tara:strand:+ start:250 stop:447 length:198 start_codon:yes stop_codon:yes gene_type:complete